MKIVISGLMVCLSMVACNVRESKETGGRYAADTARLIAKGKELAGKSGLGNCLPLQTLKDMNEEDLRAWQAYLRAKEVASQLP